MKFKIYQVNMERDEKRIAFQDLEGLEHLHGSREIDSSLYDMVYEADMDCSNLEDIFRVFNLEHPMDYVGRSLSVSDVVEVLESKDVEPGFYFCDSFGFQQVEFDAESAVQKQKNTIRVVLLEPGKEARIVEIAASPLKMQAVVGGDYEAIYPFEEEVCLVCNAEAKNTGMPLNRAIREEETEVDMSYGELTVKFREAECRGDGKHVSGYIVITEDSFRESYPVEARTYAVSSNNKAFQPNMGGYSIYGSAIDGSDPMVRLERYLAAEKGGKDGWKIERCFMKEPGREIVEIIAGPCFICDCSGPRFGSLNDEQLKRYLEKFRCPEDFLSIGGEIIAVPYKPKDKGQER